MIHRVDQLVGLELASELAEDIRLQAPDVAIGDLEQDAERCRVQWIAERVGHDPSFDLYDASDEPQVCSMNYALTVRVLGVLRKMHGQIGRGIVFHSPPPLLEQGQASSRVVRPKGAID